MRIQSSGFRVQGRATGCVGSADPTYGPSPHRSIAPSLHRSIDPSLHLSVPVSPRPSVPLSLRPLVSLSPCLLVALLAIAGCGGEGAARQPEKIFGNQGIGPGEFVNPRAVAVGPDSAVYVIDKTARVQRFSADGKFETYWQMPEWKCGKPTGVMVDAQNHVWVADTHYARIIVYDRDGHELERFGTNGEGPGQFIFPTHVVLAPDGTRYVSEYGGNDRISRFSADWKYLGSFGGQGAGEAALRRPQTMALDKDGTLWVADAGNHRICHFSGDGKFLSSFGSIGNEPGQLKFPYGLALCPDGTLLVSEFENNRVQRFDHTGKSLEIWGGPGTQPGQLAEAWGVAVGRDGRFYVADCKNHRVQVFRM
jgi:DNA-binding beta-propeller fold protein YncE